MSAKNPEDLSRLFVERANAGDAAGLAALYEPDAVLAYPPGSTTVGRAAIQAVCEQMLKHVPHFDVEEALPTIHHGDLALTSTKAKDGTGGRVQIVRRQPDGTWLRVIDRPENAG
ncbi:nuclear transport factor 2 family protein [Dactylosporangium vinaceum]|uniref:YybH family protein n=1 Tax=Dactylosporangium vinaceum TaxID=53362 RepID=A0ABV5M003_9ACTN|nr:nuclear transport factor 2 family protein [Dactylosporangium vinaceum]UAB98118.1 nuclear transport factor 2 family protein [Dactylosporangium vinaceum]